MNYNMESKHLTVAGYLYTQVDLGLLLELGRTRVPTHITAYLLYCHLNSSRKPWFFAEPHSRSTFNVASRTLRMWLSRMHEHGVITLATKKKGRWPKLRFNTAKGIPCGYRIGPGGVPERFA